VGKSKSDDISYSLDSSSRNAKHLMRCEKLEFTFDRAVELFCCSLRSLSVYDDNLLRGNFLFSYYIRRARVYNKRVY